MCEKFVYVNQRMPYGKQQQQQQQRTRMFLWNLLRGWIMIVLIFVLFIVCSWCTEKRHIKNVSGDLEICESIFFLFYFHISFCYFSISIQIFVVVIKVNLVEPKRIYEHTGGMCSCCAAVAVAVCLVFTFNHKIKLNTQKLCNRWNKFLANVCDVER